jgi:hypothetical protein
MVVKLAQSAKLGACVINLHPENKLYVEVTVEGII